jgi:tetratricopeptide (TPR) repeat protein
MAQADFDKANQSYQREQYKEAIQGYQKLLNDGQESAELHFNLGNCYYKLHEVAPAIYHYEKALQLNPNDREIQTNLVYANKRTIDDIKVIPKVGFHQLIGSYTSALKPSSWGIWAIVLSFMAVGLFIGFYLSYVGLFKRLYFIGMMCLLLGVAVTTIAGFYEQNRIDSMHPAIVFDETAPVKSEPKASAPDAFVLHAGTKVEVLETLANWRKIELSDETTGWIDADKLKEL